MCCSMLFGFLVGVVIFRALRRWSCFRMGHGCGGCRRWDGGPGWRSYHAPRGDGYGPGFNVVPATPVRPLDELVAGLELNQRQASEAAPLFSLIRERFGQTGPATQTALQILAAERFDPGPLLPQLGGLPDAVRGDLVDGLEHVHTILILEQREALRRALQRR